MTLIKYRLRNIRPVHLAKTDLPQWTNLIIDSVEWYDIDDVAHISVEIAERLRRYQYLVCVRKGKRARRVATERTVSFRIWSPIPCTATMISW